MIIKSTQYCFGTACIVECDVTINDSEFSVRSARIVRWGDNPEVSLTTPLTVDDVNELDWREIEDRAAELWSDRHYNEALERAEMSV